MLGLLGGSSSTRTKTASKQSSCMKDCAAGLRFLYDRTTPPNNHCGSVLVRLFNGACESPAAAQRYAAPGQLLEKIVKAFVMPVLTVVAQPASHHFLRMLSRSMNEHLEKDEPVIRELLVRIRWVQLFFNFGGGDHGADARATGAAPLSIYTKTAASAYRSYASSYNLYSKYQSASG